MRLALALVLLSLLTAAPAAAQDTVRVPMRDGVELSATIFRPTVEKGTRVPVIVTLTPYHALYKGLGLNSLEGHRFVQLGYAFVVADVRGTYASGGCWDYGGEKERTDGYDLVEWLAAQPWSNGRVGMIGGSYDGTTANAAAVEDPPHLATIVPISSISRWWGYAYQGYTRATLSGEDADIDPPGVTPPDFMFAYGFLPPPEAGAAGAFEQIAERWTPCDREAQLEHGYDLQPDYDDFWKARDYLRRADRVRAPALIAHGLLDFNVKTWEGTQWYEALPGEKAMVLGQWPHASPSTSGNDPDWDEFLERWFERWLYEVPNGVENEAPVRVESADGEFTNRWRWAGSETRVLPLEGETKTILDDGTLTESEMARDPAGGTRFAKVPVEGVEGIHFAGRPKLRLVASSDAPGTQFVAVLADVDDTGDATVVSRAFLNARYRGGREIGEDLTPDAKEVFDLEFIDKDWTVAEGHRLELWIGSSSTTWVAPDEQRGASNTLYIGESSLELPVMTAADLQPPPAPAPPAPAAPAPPAPAPVPAAPADTTPPAVRLTLRKRGRTVRVQVRCASEACSGRVTVTGVRRALTFGLAAGRTRSWTVKPGRRTRTLRATLVAHDAAGNRAQIRRSLKLRSVR